ncbi:hypothetical protein CEUSTIGMA_g11535.t1 [Chlamydomonas eustigma]|uniref:Ionotropic glutamate receptor C-terminal domain-containing protein n=1 Tax=Chlamydomonas eustigma TaxID=1157962 RepID=A0A250XMJ1_9CHLO|nr:hypothetical protein CEUSTIGMA_g11535.t1 [Chlamydomonas eustigma]|eukprot:GAX84112.1 hypothetical protein CEUSTIGMA_g11535.t1 [Chlamydomonas eustigma]
MSFFTYQLIVTFAFAVAADSKNVCVTNFFPMDSCAANGTVDNFSGFETELFKAVANELNSSGLTEWAPSNWSFSCIMNFSSAWLDIQSQSSQRFCDILLGAVTSSDVAGTNLEITTETYQGNARVMIYEPSYPTVWWFLQPFEWRVWFLVFASPVVVALSLLVVEYPWWRVQQVQSGGPAITGSTRVCLRGTSISADKGSPGFLLSGAGSRWLAQVQWSALGLGLQSMFDLIPRSPGGRIIALGASFTAMITFSMYISALSAQLATFHLQRGVSSVSDLATVPVGIPKSNLNAFEFFTYQLFNVVPLPWGTDAERAAVLASLRAGSLAAVVMDNSYVTFMTSSNCNLYMVGNMLPSGGCGIVFPGDTPQSYIQNFDNALAIMVANGVMDQLESEYIQGHASCPNKNPPRQTDLIQIGGVWIFVAAGIGLAVLMNVGSWVVAWAMQRIVPRLAASSGLGARSGPKAAAAGLDLDPVGVVKEIPQNPITAQQIMDETHMRLDLLESKLDQLPVVVAATLDTKLAEFRDELAAVFAYQLSKARGVSQGN